MTCAEDKTGNAQDGLQVTPMDLLKAELFYPQREENIATEATVKKMAIEVSDCLLTELRDPKKVTSNYLSSADGEFSWGKTTDEEHVAGIGMMTTNDPSKLRTCGARHIYVDKPMYLVCVYSRNITKTCELTEEKKRILILMK